MALNLIDGWKIPDSTKLLQSCIFYCTDWCRNDSEVWLLSVSQEEVEKNNSPEWWNGDFRLKVNSKQLQYIHVLTLKMNKRAQLSLTNPRDAKACQKLLQFDVLTTLSLTILAYLHAFSCFCIRNLRNPEKCTENSKLWSSRSSKVIDVGVNRKPMYDFLLVTNSNFGRICYRFRDIDA